MKFAHLADIHIGAWRDPAMKEMPLQAFAKTVDILIDKKIDFAIIAGDLFNTALPAIDHLQSTVVLLKKLKTANIAVYVVPGSHDYNAAGKSIIDVLEEADLLVNVMKSSFVDEKIKLKFTIDKKTGAKLTGLGGRRGTLERNEYSLLDSKSLSAEQGFKIFVFHSAVEEMKPKEMQPMMAINLQDLPSGFDYYAGGHVHLADKIKNSQGKLVVFPGPLFPAGFSELWSLEKKGFWLYDNGELEFVDLLMHEIKKIQVNAEAKSVAEVNDVLLAEVSKCPAKDLIVMIRISGKLKSGKTGDIDFRSVFKELYAKGAYFVMRNTSALSSLEFEEVKISSGTAEQVEAEAIASHKSGTDVFKDEAAIIKSLIEIMSSEQRDGEKKYEYEERLKKEIDGLLGL